MLYMDSITVQLYVERIMHKPGFPLGAVSKNWYSSLAFMFIGWCLPSLFHSIEFKDYGFMDCDTVYFGRW